MNYFLAAIFLTGTALAYPIAEKDETAPGVPLVIADYSSVAKSEEVHHEVGAHDSHKEVHSDASHEHHGVHHDSSESSEESGSSESAERPQQAAQPLPEAQQQQQQQQQPAPARVICLLLFTCN